MYKHPNQVSNRNIAWDSEQLLTDAIDIILYYCGIQCHVFKCIIIIPCIHGLWMNFETHFIVFLDHKLFTIPACKLWPKLKYYRLTDFSFYSTSDLWPSIKWSIYNWQRFINSHGLPGVTVDQQWREQLSLFNVSILNMFSQDPTPRCAWRMENGNQIPGRWNTKVFHVQLPVICTA